jgi:hypothetical protein
MKYEIAMEAVLITTVHGSIAPVAWEMAPPHHDPTKAITQNPHGVRVPHIGARFCSSFGCSASPI